MCAVLRRVYPQRADTEDPYPPPRLGMVVVDEVFAKVGAANDVVIVRRPDGSLTVSDFHVSTDRHHSGRAWSDGGVRTTRHVLLNP